MQVVGVASQASLLHINGGIDTAKKLAAPSFVACSRNFLDISLFENWRETVLVCLMIPTLGCAVMAFVAGEWLFGVVFSVSVLVEFILRKEIHDYANLQAAFKEMNGQNAQFKESNLKLKRNIGDLTEQVEAFKEQLPLLEKQIKEQAQENRKFAENNLVYEQLTRSMVKEAAKIGAMFQGVVSGGQEINRGMLKEYLQATKALEAQVGIVRKIKEELDEGHESAMKHIRTLSKQLQTAGVDHLKIVGEAREQVTKLTAEVNRLTAQREGEMKRLKRLLKEIERAETRLKGSVSKIDRASNRNLHTAERVQEVLFKRVGVEE